MKTLIKAIWCRRDGGGGGSGRRPNPITRVPCHILRSGNKGRIQIKVDEEWGGRVTWVKADHVEATDDAVVVIP